MRIMEKQPAQSVLNYRHPSVRWFIVLVLCAWLVELTVQAQEGTEETTPVPGALSTAIEATLVFTPTITPIPAEVTLEPQPAFTALPTTEAGRTSAARDLFNQSQRVLNTDLMLALDLLTQAINTDPGYLPAYSNRCFVLNQLNRPDLALRDCDFVLRYDEAALEAIINRGESFRLLGDLNAAANAFSRAIELASDVPVLYHKRGLIFAEGGRYDLAIQDYDRALQLNRQETGVWIDRARANFVLGNLAEALDDLDVAIEQAPGNPALYILRADIYVRRGESPAAIREYEAALTIDPDYAPAYLARGRLQAAVANYEAALADYDQALAINPDYAAVYAARGNLYRQTGQDDAAVESYTRAIDIAPQLVDAYLNRGLVYFEREEFLQALRDFNGALSINPDNALGYRLRAAVFLEIGAPLDAVDDYTRAIEIEPGNAVLYNARGEVYLAIGRLGAAELDFVRALQIDSTWPQPLIGLSDVYYNADDLERALEATAQYMALAEASAIPRMIERFNELLDAGISLEATEETEAGD